MSPRINIIAEIGINFNGSYENCLRLIDAAAEAGCDSAKFQVFSAKTLYPEKAGKLAWHNGKQHCSYDIFSSVRRNELPRQWIGPLMAHCARRNIAFLASVFSESDAHFLMKKGAKSLKISSSSVQNLPLIERCATYNVPLIVSTGGCRLGEIEDVVETVHRWHRQLTLLHCTLQYPTLPENCNLGVIETLTKAFPDVTVGYSDHTEHPLEVPVQAVYLGARVIEKHITLDRNMPGPDHFFAIEPDALRRMVVAIRSAEKKAQSGQITIDPRYYGTSRKSIFAHERYLRQFVENQLFARREIHKGEVITAEDLVVLRKGEKPTGLPPRYIQLFREHTVTASRDIFREDPIQWNMIL
jgi:N-acetylneuraminate synthase